MARKGLIINADDFGYDSDVNLAVLASFSKGLCSSTTIMPNMPGFEEACELCHENDLTERVGLHLVLCEGFPLTDRIKKQFRVCDKEGRFLNARRPQLFTLNSAEKDAIYEEISAQTDRCRKYGIPITHIDSHCHVHAEWGIAGILLRVARDKRLRYIRLTRHLDPNSTWIKNLYRRFLNLRIMLKGAAATEYFGTVEDFVRLKQITKHNSSISSFEVMIHPVFNEDRILIDKISKEKLEQYIARVDGYRHAISFGCIAGA